MGWPTVVPCSSCTTFNASCHLAVDKIPVVAEQVQGPEEKWKTLIVGEFSIARGNEKLANCKLESDITRNQSKDSLSTHTPGPKPVLATRSLLILVLFCLRSKGLQRN